MQLICIKINKFSLSIQIKGFPPTISIRQTSKRLLNRQIKSIGITLVNWVKVFLFNTYYFKQPKTKHCNKLTLKCWGEWLEGIPVEPSMFYLAAGCSHVLHCTWVCVLGHMYTTTWLHYLWQSTPRWNIHCTFTVQTVTCFFR